MLEIKELTASVEGTPILKGVNLSIQAGDIHAIMGPNGAGKSTLAKVLAGHPAYEVTGGEVWFKGQNLLELEPEERAHLGLFMSFQYPVEIPGVSNSQFLKIALNAKRKARGEPELPDQEFEKLLDQKMKQMEIRPDLRTRNVNENFSGGEKKRNEILQMAVLSPALALLDETDSGLDIDAMRIVARGVNQLMSPEMGLLLITHYQRLLDYIKPNFVHVMLGGKIVQSGGAELALELESKGYDWLVRSPEEEAIFMMAQPGLEHQLFTTLLEKHQAANNQEDPLQKARQKAWNHFLEIGLPTKQTEVYRYIKLRNLFSQNYELAEEAVVTADKIAPFVLPECQGSLIVFVNGNYSPALSKRENLPSSLVISTLQEASHAFGALFNNHWTKSLKEEEDPFAILNGALHRQGAFLYIPPKIIVETPIQILHVITAQDHLLMLLPRVNIFVGGHAQATFISTQSQSGSNGYFVNHVVELVLEENAHVNYTQILDDEHPQAWHLEALRAQVKRNATLKTVAFTEGSMTVRTDYRVALTGENAEALLNGVWMLFDKREAHTHVFIDHQAPNCRSYQLFKGVLPDFSRSSFEGKIMVRQAAQKTEAFQLNNNLILNDHAHADSKPNLEIFADDVKASHGATVGQLDPEQLFYMKTRGFPEAEAKNLLIYGFAEQVIEIIPVASIREALSKKARRYLTKDVA